MNHPDLLDWLTTRPKELAKGPIAILLFEDASEVASTLAHHLRLGFARILALSPTPLLVEMDEVMAQQITNLRWDTRGGDAHVGAVNAINEAVAPGTWLYYGFNAEYLFYPFCETRRVGEMLTFHVEERRAAMLAYVIDLYPDDRTDFPDQIKLKDAHFDRIGYYALSRLDKDKNGLERQMNFHGGLRWRFEELLPQDRLRIDRVPLFRAANGLTLLPDHRFNDEEYNTYACEWHHSLTASVASFRVAKALARNPRSSKRIEQFVWSGSEPFHWSSHQLMEAGLMEPGQWF